MPIRQTDTPGGIRLRGSVTREPNETLAEAEAELYWLLADACPDTHQRVSFQPQHECDRGGRRHNSRRINGQLYCKPLKPPRPLV